ncbi:restriction endonuclease subunit S [Enterobacter hormaechei subsp. hoffmannii]|uniref:restriction endonuclease subunit S n=1 Tax=Enterobacter hormaechei TaxID=158836 RepID=UPI002237562C|nr:restriction endonuclease subunit S [Enterobacter hormaechei]MCW4745231.1 restriction endonuclease subunit S [Enterobacter hormaechei subsp. hoffmannii]
MSEWTPIKLGSVVNITNGFAFKSKDFLTSLTSNALPVLKIKNIANGDVHLKDVQYHLIDAKYGKYISSKGDILIALTGNHPQALTQVVGAVSKQKFETLTYVNQRVAKIEPISDLAFKDFIYYFLKDKSTHEYLANQSSGSANQANISKADIENVELLLPPFTEQKTIAYVLSSLDDKIDLLHRQNKTLGSMAEALFRQWFIEEAQEDWDTIPLTKVATFTNGLACQKFPAIPGEPSMPVLKIKELNSGISSITDLATANIKDDYIVNHGDVIFAWSASLMVKIWSGPVCVLNQHLFKVTSDTYPKWFYLEWCKYYLEEFINISQSHATTMGHIKRKDLDEAMVKIPSNNELVCMTAEIGPLLDQRIEKMRQIRTLETLRDTLLPKLMSGEVRVQYAEEAIASVA